MLWVSPGVLPTPTPPGHVKRDWYELMGAMGRSGHAPSTSTDVVCGQYKGSGRQGAEATQTAGASTVLSRPVEAICLPTNISRAKP